MKVYIIGAGPGDPELITVKGARLISECPVVLYTGSLVPLEVLRTARSDATILDSSGMTLEEIMQTILTARERDQNVARVHTGDPSIFGSTAEQVRLMEEAGIEYEVIPGVSSFVAAAAVLGKELTLPELSQTVIISRVEGRTPMPQGEQLADLARHGSTLVLFLSITLLKRIQKELIPVLGEDCPIAVVHKATLPDQKVVIGTLATIGDQVREQRITTQSMIIIGRVLTSTDFANSRLYAADFSHRFRKKTTSGNL